MRTASVPSGLPTGRNAHTFLASRFPQGDVCIMILHPQHNVAQILVNNPQLADNLLNLLLWAISTPKVTLSPDFDEILDMLYVHVPDYRVHRDAHIKSLTEGSEAADLFDHQLDQHVDRSAFTCGSA